MPVFLHDLTYLQQILNVHLSEHSTHQAEFDFINFSKWTCRDLKLNPHQSTAIVLFDVSHHIVFFCPILSHKKYTWLLIKKQAGVELHASSMIHSITDQWSFFPCYTVLYEELDNNLTFQNVFNLRVTIPWGLKWQNPIKPVHRLVV